MPRPVAAVPVLPPRPGAAPALVLIGVSTGGPRALEQVLPRLPVHFPAPIVVAQHMPATFTGVLAKRLNERCALDVVEAAETRPIRPGTIAIAAGDRDLVVERDGDGFVLRPVPTDSSPWHPSADRLVRSAMACLPARRLVGVLLPGMGNDGAQAMAALQAGGGCTIAEAESTAVVFGMPGDLVRRGGATAVLPVERVAERLIEWCVPAAPARRVAAV
jgi:two-component system chemotaxis response regulator CheB